MLRKYQSVLAIAALALSACASDGTTSPASGDAPIEARLVATLTQPTIVSMSSNVSMQVTINNTLSESVSGGVCASVVQARAASATEFVDVASSLVACSMQAMIIVPGATGTISASADPEKLRSVAGGVGRSVVVRVRHSLAGANASYTLQSNDITMNAP
jgi:hypothetical protein